MAKIVAKEIEWKHRHDGLHRNSEYWDGCIGKLHVATIRFDTQKHEVAECHLSLGKDYDLLQSDRRLSTHKDIVHSRLTVILSSLATIGSSSRTASGVGSLDGHI